MASRPADYSSGPEEGELSESESSASERPNSPNERSHSPNWNRSPARANTNKSSPENENGGLAEELPEEELVLKRAKFSPTVASQELLPGISSNSELQVTAGQNVGEPVVKAVEPLSRRSSRSTGSRTRPKTPPRSASREKSRSRSRSRSRSATRSLSRSSQQRAAEQSETAKAKSASKSKSKSKSRSKSKESRSSSGSRTRKRRSPTNNFPNCSSCSRRSTATLSTRSSSEPEVVEDGDAAREQALTTGKRKGEFYVYNPNYRNQHYQRSPGGRPEPPLIREHRLRPENASGTNTNQRREWSGGYNRAGAPPPLPLPLPPPPDPNWAPPSADFYYYDSGPGYGYEGEYWPPYRPPPPPLPLPPMPPRGRPVAEYSDYPPADFLPPPGDYYPPPPDMAYDDRVYYEAEPPGRHSRSRSPIPAGSKRSPSANASSFRRARSNSIRQ